MNKLQAWLAGLWAAVVMNTTGCDWTQDVNFTLTDWTKKEQIDKKDLCPIVGKNWKNIFFVKIDVWTTCDDVRNEVDYFVQYIPDDVNYSSIIDKINQNWNLWNLEIIEDNTTTPETNTTTPDIDILPNEYIIDQRDPIEFTLLEPENFDIYKIIQDNFADINYERIKVTNDNNEIYLEVFYDDEEWKKHKIEQTIVLNRISDDELNNLLDLIFNDTLNDENIDCTINPVEEIPEVVGQYMTSIELKDNLINNLNLNSHLDFNNKPTWNIKIINSTNDKIIFENWEYLISEEELKEISVWNIDFIFGEWKITFNTSDWLKRSVYNY